MPQRIGTTDKNIQLLVVGHHNLQNGGIHPWNFIAKSG